MMHETTSSSLFSPADPSSVIDMFSIRIFVSHEAHLTFAETVSS